MITNCYIFTLGSGGERPIGLILIGPTRIGKTCWARSLGPHIYWGGSTTIRDADWGGVDYIVVDDVPWDYFVGKKQFLGGQHEFILTEKYIRKTRIVFGKPVIYLCNENPFPDMKDVEERDYFLKNVVVHDMEEERFFEGY